MQWPAIGHFEATKLHAVTAILEMTGHSFSDTISFGDDTNDLELIRASDIGVAVGNAEEKVKAVADFVSATNEEDGVVVFLGGHGLIN